MANFLINAPSSNQVGTTSADLFSIQTSQAVSVFGLEGDDTLSADYATVSAARFNGGKGADTINISGVQLAKSDVFAGMGKDSLDIDGGLSASIVRGGAGLDTIDFIGLANKSTINGNDMADRISSQYLSNSTAGFLGAGAGKDRVSAIFESGGDGFTINGGLGHDSIQIVHSDAAAQLSAFVVAGGGGLDTINFDANAAITLTAAFSVDGGDQNDRILFAGSVSGAGTATINGGLGADKILFSADFNVANGDINLGAGADSVHISGNFADGTLNGGLGADTISLTQFATADVGSEIIGDGGADKFDLGTLTVNTGVALNSGGSVLAYTSFDQSNLSATDFASATVTIGASVTNMSGAANLLTVKSDVVDFTVFNGGNSTTFTGTDGIAAFTSTHGTEVTARMESVDNMLTKGQSIYFANSSNNSHYLFVQGGAAGSGVANDLLLQLNTAVQALSAASDSALDLRIVTAG
jgi:hypothetical protein